MIWIAAGRADQETYDVYRHLLNALRDMSTDFKGLYFRVALRADVYFLVTNLQTNSTDKVEGSVIWYSWTNHEIFKIARQEGWSCSSTGRLNESQLSGMQQWQMSQILDEIMEFHDLMARVIGRTPQCIEYCSHLSGSDRAI